MLEISWYGRGGQGTKTAAMLLAQTAMKEGCGICTSVCPQHVIEMQKE